MAISRRRVVVAVLAGLLGLPTIIIFRILNRPVIHGPEPVPPAPERGQRGGGRQYWSGEPVLVQLLNSWSLR